MAIPTRRRSNSSGGGGGGTTAPTSATAPPLRRRPMRGVATTATTSPEAAVPSSTTKTTTTPRTPASRVSSRLKTQTTNATTTTTTTSTTTTTASSSSGSNNHHKTNTKRQLLSTSSNTTPTTTSRRNRRFKDDDGEDDAAAVLPAISPQGKHMSLRIQVQGQAFRMATTEDKGTATTATSNIPLGHDGNTFYCETCGEVGDVVCCDGCPRVYHGTCVPPGPSQDSLDEEPWYCPTCYPSHHHHNDNNNMVGSTSGTTTPNAVLSKQQQQEEEDKEHVCFECQKGGAAATTTTTSTATSKDDENVTTTITMQQCESCQKWMHYPKCPTEEDNEEDEEDDEDEDDSPRKRALQEGLLQAKDLILCNLCKIETIEEERRGVVVGSASTDAPDQEDENQVNSDADKDDEDEDDEEEDSETDHAMDVDEVDKKDDSSSSLQTPLNRKAKKTTLKSKISKKSRLPTSLQNDEERNTGDDDAPIAARKRRRAALPSSKVKENMEIEEEEEEDEEEDQEEDNDDDVEAPSPPTTTTGVKRKKKVKSTATSNKKKIKVASTKSSNASSPSSTTSSRRSRSNSQEASTVLEAASGILSHSLGYPKAIPAFFYFLGEHRHKLERHLARKHRTFIRLPKGMDRNQLIAEEGAVWWGKLKEEEVRKYMELSMQDYEDRIMEWKEEKTIRDMYLEHENTQEEYDVSFEDEVLTYENHQRLYLGTDVGSKPYKPDPESLSNQNRVLLELLQDVRFHPTPMMQTQRTEDELNQTDYERVTIPFFDVHGPFSTSVGDECLGCTRGWVHFCPVLKRRLPAVEHRARLQPPLSSLTATRIGLGLRPKLLPDPKVPEVIQNFTSWERPESGMLHKQPMAAVETLSDPSSRADDVVQFIEEVQTMKNPEPIRPDFPNRIDFASPRKFSENDDEGVKTSASSSAKERHYDTVGGEGSAAVTLMKCGRCRTVISTDTGCVQCRRAQLVINLSRRPPPDQAAEVTSVAHNTLKVDTQMCGRATNKDTPIDPSNDPDYHVAHGILRQRWTPFAILPPNTIVSPTPKSKIHPNRPKQIENDSEDSQDGSEDSEEDLMVEKQSEEELSDPGGDDVSISSQSNSKGDAMAMEVDEDESGETSSTSIPEPTTAVVGSRSKRLRSARIAKSTTTSTSKKDDPTTEEEFHKEWQNRFKEESEDLQKRCLERATCGILLGLMRRDPLLLFASPVTSESYLSIIKQPMDFGTIRTKVLEDKYASLGSFAADCRLLCTNALAYNPAGSLYSKCAKEIYDVLTVMQRRAQKWMTAIKDAHSFAWRKARKAQKQAVLDPFKDLRETWPKAVDMLEDAAWLRRQVEADFMRTRENEIAYYSALAVRRTAAGAEAALAPYPDSGGVFNVVARRSHLEDEALRQMIDERVGEITHPVELKDLPGWREDAIMRILRRAQTRRLESMSSTNVGCARCDGTPREVQEQSKSAQLSRLTKYTPKRNEQIRIDMSRQSLSTGMASQATRDRIQSVLSELKSKKDWTIKAEAAKHVAVTVRGSGIHGWGLYADQYFEEGDVVAEYIGEYVSLGVTEAREKMYRDYRIQDYQFRLDDQFVIDATLRGGHGRYINHNCTPNCIAKIIPGAAPNEHLKRVIIIAQRRIEPREELTYDYQFPLELDLNARIPCNCMSDQCRGFMNWDLPEKGSATQSFRTQKRGANMRDRIRRLGRPLKSDKSGGGDFFADDDDLQD